MKKMVLIFVLLFSSVSLAACGKKDTGKETEEVSSTDLENDQEEVSPTEEDEEIQEEPEEDPYLDLAVSHENAGMFYCQDGYGDRYIVDEDSNVIAQLPENAVYRKFENGEYFSGGYFMLDDNSVWTGDGKKVFELEGSGYDGIFYTDTLDVDYLILFQNVNSFEETGTHYFAYNVKDGSSYQLEGLKYPDRDVLSYPGQDYWFYFGNGNFIFAPPNSGFGNEHSIFHLQTGEAIPSVISHADGEITSTMPDIYFWDAFNYDAQALYGIYEDDDGYNYCMIYHFDTGVAELRSLREQEDYESVWYVGETYAENAVKMGWGKRYADEHAMLLDYETGIFTPMDGYKEYEAYYKKDGAYLCLVKNDGGGRFATVIEPDGSRRFEPIAAEGLQKYNENYFATYDADEEITRIYDWNGNQLAEVKCHSAHTSFGDTTMVYSDISFADDGRTMGDTFLVNALTGEVKEIAPLIRNGEEWTYLADDTEINADGYYECRGLVLNEKGELKYLRLKK